MADSEPHAPEAMLKPNQVSPLWILFGVASIVFGLALFITQALLLSATPVVRRCSYIAAIGGVFLVIAVVIVLSGVAALVLKSRRLAPAPDNVNYRTTAFTVFRRVVLLAATLLLYAVVAFVCVVGVSVYSLTRNVPSYSRDFSGGSLGAPVSVQRDAAGLPHITANTLEDALFAQGFVHAQDRIAQLEVLRLFATGRIASVVGVSGLTLDRLSRTLGIRQAGEASCRALDNTTRRLLQRYVDGINFFLANDGSRPPEFMFMEAYFVYHEPELFKIDEICSIFRVLQYQLSSNADRERQRFALFFEGRLTFDEIEELYDARINGSSALSAAELGYNDVDVTAYRAREAATMQLEKELYDTAMTRIIGSASPRRQELAGSPRPTSASGVSWWESLLRPEGWYFNLETPIGGSNAWMSRAPNQPAAGASDPHLVSELPSVWHYAHLSVAGSDFAGTTMPGVPGIVIGRTPHLSWGITLALTDLADHYVMVPDPARAKTHYQHFNASLPYTTRTEVIAVRGKQSETLVVRESLYGPDVSEIFSAFQGLDTAVCLSTAVLGPDETSLPALLSLFNTSKIRTVNDFRTHFLDRIVSPGLSVSFADGNAGLGYAITGHHPIRVPGHTGRYPTLGNGSYAITQLIPAALNPGKLDTVTGQRGFVRCANERAYPDGFPFSLSYDWAAPHRSQWIERMLKNAPDALLSKHEFHAVLQNDVSSPMWILQLAPWFNSSSGAKFLSLLNTDGVSAMQRLRQWNGSAYIGSTEPYMLWSWILEVCRLPRKALAVSGVYSWYPDTYILRILMSPGSPTLVQCRSSTVAPLSSIANVDYCLEYAAQVFNDKAKTWRAGSPPSWGEDVNRFSVRSSLLHGSPLECAASRSQRRGGDMTSVNVAGFSASLISPNFEVNQPPGMRQLYEWSSPTGVWFSLPGGESGNFMSPFYTNFLDDYYGTGTYFSVKFSSITSISAQRLS